MLLTEILQQLNTFEGHPIPTDSSATMEAAEQRITFRHWHIKTNSDKHKNDRDNTVVKLASFIMRGKKIQSINSDFTSFNK